MTGFQPGALLRAMAAARTRFYVIGASSSGALSRTRRPRISTCSLISALFLLLRSRVTPMGAAL
jgi:hypothetical protein